MILQTLAPRIPVKTEGNVHEKGVTDTDATAQTDIGEKRAIRKVSLPCYFKIICLKTNMMKSLF